MPKLTDAELIALCDSAIRGSVGQGADLASERADALDRYLGAKYGNEVEGRSQVRTREVLDVVETALPSLVRVFAQESNLAEFQAVSMEDEEAASQESEVISHVFWNLCDGYSTLYTAAKDGLLSKNGIAKVWWEQSEHASRESYRGLLPIEREALLSQEDVAVEVEEEAVNEDGSIDLTAIVTRPAGQPRIQVIPPEEFGISGTQNSLDCDKATFVFQRSRKTLADLVALGHSRQKVQNLSNSYNETEEVNARYTWEDEANPVEAEHWSMREVWVTEAYPLVDRDDDGVAERLKVTLVGGSGSYTLLDVEEVDGQPFVSWSPIPRTHAWVGLSLADMALDVQEQKTALLRGILDNMYLANNSRTAVNERVNLQDLTVSRPGGVVRTEGAEPPAQHIYQFQSAPVPPQTFELMEYLDRVVKARTGIGDDVAGLDTKALSNVNTGVAALAYDMARMRIELIARNFGEHFVRPLWLKLHELLRKHGDRPMAVRLRNQWVQVLPQEWRERTNLSVKVGVGVASREQRMLALQNVLQIQQVILSAGGLNLVNPANLYMALTDLMDLTGLPGAEAKYFTDPRRVPPQQPQPDPKMLELQQKGQVEAAKLQVDQGRLQIDAQKAQTDAQLKAQELALREREVALKAEVEHVKAQMAMQERAINERSEVLNAQAEVMARAQEARAREQAAALERVRLDLEAMQAAREQAERRYEADLKAAVEMAKLQAQQQQAALAAVQSQMVGLAERPAQAPVDLAPLVSKIEELGRRLESPPAREAAPVINLAVGGSRKRLTLVRDEEGRVTGGESVEVEDES